MNNHHSRHEFTNGVALSRTRQAGPKKFTQYIISVLTTFSVTIASTALTCLSFMSAAHAQTSVVCDAPGDSIFGNGNGGPQVPPWLDIAQVAITDAGDGLLFTYAVNAPIPLAPTWSVVEEDGGQLWWSWRLVNSVADIGFVSNGCLQAKGQNVPACYCLDLIWSVQAQSFRARLLDDTTCAEIALPFAFSPDRSAFNLLVPKALFTNPALVANPNSFQFLTEVIVWKNGSNGNTALSILDNAPTQGNGPFILGTWDSSTHTSVDCP